MSADGDHHYVPKFHLEKWCRADGLFLQWGRIAYNGNLFCKPVTPAATAYVPGLYLLSHVGPEEAQKVENLVFGKIDNEAAKILPKLIARGPNSLTDEERYWWTVYLNASLFRVPHIVERIKAGAKERLETILTEAQSEYEAIKRNATEASLLEWANNHAPDRIANSGMKILVRLVNGERAIDRIINFYWNVVDVSRAPRRLMLGDNPFLRVGDLYKPRTVISIPLSPTHIFFGSDALDIVEHFAALPARELVKRCNIDVLTTAQKFAYGEAEREFVDRHLLKGKR